MDNNIANPNKEVLFHPVNTDISNERQKVAEHVGTHYRKYLFWIGALCGFTISLVARVFFGTSATTSTTSAGYESLTPEVNAVIIFNEMDAIAHEKDNFFHSTGKIYTMSGDTLFHKYDTMYHVLDNAFHRAIDTQEKLKRAQRLETFINIQNDLFASTAYANTQQDIKFAELDQSFLKMISQIKSTEVPTGNKQVLTGNTKLLTGNNKVLTGKILTGTKIAQ